MNIIKRVTIIFISLLITILPLCSSVISYAEEEIPSIGGSGSNYSNISDSKELVASFKAYCNVNGLVIRHSSSQADPIVSWNYSKMVEHADYLAINLNDLYQHIWYGHDNSGNLCFFYDSTSNDAFYRIYQRLNQEYSIHGGENKNVYSGEWFQDTSNNGCFVYIFNNNQSMDTNKTRSEYNTLVSNNTIVEGSQYRWSGALINQNMSDGQTLPYIIPYHGNNFTFYIKTVKETNNSYSQLNSTSNIGNRNVAKCIYAETSSYEYIDGHVAIFKRNSAYYVGSWLNTRLKSSDEERVLTSHYTQITDVENENDTVNLNQSDDAPSIDTNKSIEATTDSDTINNYITNNYNNVTYNETTNNNPPSDKPSPLPPTDTFPTNGDENNPFNWTMPNIAIGWHLDIDGITSIFPFSIPFDIIDFLEVFETEPVTPHIQGTIDLGVFDYRLDIDLSYFDNVASIVRNMILALYVFSLIIATRAIFHIY